MDARRSHFRKSPTLGVTIKLEGAVASSSTFLLVEVDLLSLLPENSKGGET